METDLTDAELEMLENCYTAVEWESACEAIKEARGGQYPPNWWPRVKLSGLMDRIMARWGEDSELRAYQINPDGTRTPL